MLQLVYISTAREAPTEETLKAILDTSRRNNKEAGITGLLVAGGRRFLQALEGPDQAVLDTYSRIKADRRHFAVVLLSCQAVQERSFGCWSMGFEGAGDIAPGGDLTAVVAALAGSLSDKNLRAQFNGFAQLHARAA